MSSETRTNNLRLNIADSKKRCAPSLHSRNTKEKKRTDGSRPRSLSTNATSQSRTQTFSVLAVLSGSSRANSNQSKVAQS